MGKYIYVLDASTRVMTSSPRLLKHVEAGAESECLILNLEPYRTFLALIGEEAKCHIAIWVSNNMAVPGQEFFYKKRKKSDL